MDNFRRLANYLFNLSLWGDRRTRRCILKVLDVSIFLCSIYLASALRLESLLPVTYFSEKSWQIATLILFKYFVFDAIGLYKPLLRYSGLTLLNLAGRATVISTVSLITLSYFVGDWALSRSILIIDALLTLTLVIFLRLLLRWIVREGLLKQKQRSIYCKSPTRLLIYGAGTAGFQVLQALSNSHQYRVIGFVDDNIDLQTEHSIDGLRVYPPELITTLFEANYFDTVVLAMPSVARPTRHRICQRLQQLSIPIKAVPGLDSVLSGDVTIREIRDIDVGDLLGREEVRPNSLLMRKQITQKVVVVTGAGGSIGAELCRQIVQQHPECLILYELNEFALYSIHQELTETYPDRVIIPILGNVLDTAYLTQLFRTYGVHTVYHAAAYKHVPLLEDNVLKAIENNVLGTLSVSQSAVAGGVSQFVLVSTDKAVRPTNIMGTTKRIAELIVQGLSAQPASHTCFAIVRFGNVLGSSGSVVPRFHKQIAAGGPITLTHPEITRYFMSIPEAARLVIQAGAMATGGEVFLLDMGEPVKIYDLALQMIRLSGFVPYEDIQICITGLRPGEKLYEELLITNNNVRPTHHSKIFCAEEQYLCWQELTLNVDQLLNLMYSGNISGVYQLLKTLVPEYQPQAVQASLTPSSTIPTQPHFYTLANVG